MVRHVSRTLHVLRRHVLRLCAALPVGLAATCFAAAGLAATCGAPAAAQPRADSLAAGVARADTLDTDSLRAARWKQQRRQKARRLQRPRPSIAERLVNRMAGFVERNQIVIDLPEVDLYGLRPVLGGLKGGAGTTVGLQREWFEGRPARYGLAEALVSLRRYYGVRGVLGVAHRTWVGYAFARYWHLPRERFYGVGPNTRAEERANYRLNELVGGALVGYSLRPATLVGGHLSYQAHGYGSGTDPDVPAVAEQFDLRRVPGFGADARYLVAGTFAELDTRNIPYDKAYGSRFAPTEERLRGLSLEATRGVYLAGEGRLYAGVGGRPYTYARLDLEAQEFVPLRGGYQVIALRQYAAFTYTPPGQAVPFYEMPALGGGGTIRGFGGVRFRDRNALLMNAEYRWHVLPVLDMALFLDAGHVFPTVGALSLRDLEMGGGVGFRLKSDERVLLRADLAFSREGPRLYLELGSIL